MSRDQFVTGNLHRISDKIAEAAKKHEQESDHSRQTPASSPAENIPETIFSSAVVSPEPAEEKKVPEKRKRLSDSVEASLQRHLEEGLRIQRDLKFYLQKVASHAEEERGNAKRMEEEFSSVLEKTSLLEKEFSALPEPDPDSPEYQMVLSDFHRKMEKIKLQLIPLEAHSEKISGFSHKSVEKTGEGNFFAELDSLKKRQLFRTGFWFALPGIIGSIIGAVLVAVAVFLTFKAG